MITAPAAGDPLDDALLSNVRAALNDQFADPVRLGDVPMPRSLARQIERNLLRLRINQRRAA